MDNGRLPLRRTQGKQLTLRRTQGKQLTMDDGRLTMEN
jgi:hypothetical protein